MTQGADSKNLPFLKIVFSVPCAIKSKSTHACPFVNGSETHKGSSANFLQSLIHPAFSSIAYSHVEAILAYICSYPFLK